MINGRFQYAIKITCLGVLTGAVFFLTNAKALGAVQEGTSPIELRNEQVAPASAVQIVNSGDAAERKAEAAKPARSKKPVARHVIGNKPQWDASSKTGLALHAENRLSGFPGDEKQTKPFGNLGLSLELKLSKPGSNAIRPNSPEKTGSVKSDEAPQKEAAAKEQAAKEQAAKEKALGELNARIAAMEKKIADQQLRLNAAVVPPTSANPSSGNRAQAAAGITTRVESETVANKAQLEPKVAASAMRSAPTIKKTETRISVMEINWIVPALGLASLILAALGFVRYRSKKATPLKVQRVSSHDLIDVSEVPKPAQRASAKPTAQPKQTVIAKQAAKPNVQTVAPATEPAKKPAVLPEEKRQSLLPPEYELLEEAGIYLRFGHNKLAEEVLREAIKINPKNQQPYLTLLRIYFSQEDRAEFLAVAQQLKTFEDETIWRIAAEMGRSLDPDNALYQ